jgi:hypothetical protein
MNLNQYILKLETENERMREALEEILSCAENVVITYADTNRLIIDMARKAIQEVRDA